MSVSLQHAVVERDRRFLVPAWLDVLVEVTDDEDRTGAGVAGRLGTPR